MKLLRGNRWKPVIAPCHIYYPLWKDSLAQSCNMPCRQRVGPSAGGSCDTGRVRISSARRRRPCGRCGTPVPHLIARELRWVGLRSWEGTPSLGMEPQNRVVRWLGQQSCAAGEAAYCLGRFIRVFAILTKWFSSTRLETRTKESNIYASIWVSNPDAE